MKERGEKKLKTCKIVVIVFSLELEIQGVLFFHVISGFIFKVDMEC